jgi:ABC-type sugar transport system substrate-binding protein
MRVTRVIAVLLVVSLAALALAACGSSSSSSSSSSPEEATSSEPASSESSGEESSGEEGTQTVAEAKAALKKYEQRPTSLGEEPFETPVGKPIPSGKKISFIDCGAPICVVESEIAAEAAESLGWTSKAIQTNGTPQQRQNAWVQALRENPDGILFGGGTRAELQQYFTQAKEENIPVASCCFVEPDGTQALGNGIGYNIGWNQAKVDSPVWASWINAESNGEGDAVFVSLPGSTAIEADATELKSKLGEYCPKCSLDTLGIGEPGPNTPTLIVTYLRSHPDVKYVVLGADNALAEGLPAALSAAGLSDIQVTGEGPSTEGLQSIEAGEQNSTIWFPIYEYMYGMVDFVARSLAGAETLPAYTPPAWLLTQGNIPSTTEYFPQVPNLKAQFAKLWGQG